MQLLALRCLSRRPYPLAALLLLLVASPGPPAFAQEIRAAVTGRVTDAQGAVMPGVSVVVLHVDTNTASDAITDERGSYSVRQLVPGPYRITATLNGFKTFVRDGVTLRTAETATIDVRLEVGTLEEIVTVNAELSAIESDQSTLAQTMENKRVSELPLNGRQVYMLLQLTSGTLFTQSQFGAQGFSGTRAWDVNGSLTIHGSRTGNNEFLIDGAPSAGTGGGTGSWNYSPPVDAIEEFRVQTASVDASYGRTSGGIVNLTLRSGTNQVRGSGVTLYRGTDLDARQIQNIRNNISIDGHKYFNGEGMLSGPIRRDKTFFMGGYQGFYEDIPFPTTRTVPTDLQLQGDFSQTLDAQGRVIPIFDPATTRPGPNGTFVRDQFQCNGRLNVICPDRFHPIASALAQHMPRGNVPGRVTGQDNFINSPNLGRYRYNSYLARIDQVFSDRHRLSFSNAGNWGIEFRNENGLPEPSIRSDNYPTHRNHYLATIDDTYILSPSLLLTTRVSFDRFDEPHEKQYGDINPDLPFQGPYQLSGPPFPQVNFDFYEDMFPRTFRRVKNDALSFRSSLAKTAGSHLLKAGGEFRAYNFSRWDEVASNGSFNFNNSFTRRNPLQADGSGSEFASFLLGLPSGGNVAVGTPREELYRYVALYVQDDWKIGRRATLNIGLRWDYQPPVREAENRLVTGFDPTSPNPLQGQLAPGVINPATGQPVQVAGGLLYPGQNGAGESPYGGDWNNIQPRVGFSYKVTDRLVARSNYGRSYLGLSSDGQAGMVVTDYQRSTPFTSSLDGGVTPFQPWANPFPDGFLQPRAGELGLATNLGQGLTFYNPDFKVPYTDQWMAGIDLELPWNVGLDLAYVGNRVGGLQVSRAFNAIPQSEREKAIARLGGNPNYLNEQLANPFQGLVPATGLNNATVSRNQLLRPYPQFGDITLERLNIGRATYHALEAVATKRYSNGIMVAVNYTMMRMKEATGLLNTYDAEPFYDLSGNERRHRMTITGLIDLPFGPGRAIGGSTRGLVGGLIGGWQFNVIGEIQSGTPLGMNGDAILLEDDFSLGGDQSFDRWFDNSTRTNPRPDGTFAWDTRGTNDYRQSPFRFSNVRTPSVSQWSFSLFKNTRITPRVNMQIRIETFNVFNSRLYGGPNTNPTAADFGVINTASQINFARTTQLGLRFQF